MAILGSGERLLVGQVALQGTDPRSAGEKKPTSKQVS